MNQRGEASVEEILDSIKKVIARDNRDGLIAARRHRETAGMAAQPQDDEADEVFDLAGTELIEEPHDRTDQGHGDEELDEASLVTSAVRSSMQENFAALSLLAEPGARPQIVRSGETSLEGLVREMLRPMLAEWLDSNLPGMVERLVKAEIARIARKRS